jgi:hypothetical protein
MADLTYETFRVPRPPDDLNIRKSDPLRNPSNQAPSPPRPIAMSRRPRNKKQHRCEKRRAAATASNDKRKRGGIRIREGPQRLQHEKEQKNSAEKINHSMAPV